VPGQAHIGNQAIEPDLALYVLRHESLCSIEGAA
jgi:hypothetical protein